MSTRISKTSSYEQVAQEDNECDDHKDQGIKDPDDNLPSLNSNQSTQSSAAIIASFEEISSEAYEKQKVIKHRKDKGKIDKKEATSQLKQAYKTLAHTLTKDDLSLEYNTDLTNGLTSDQVNKLYTTIGYNELIPPKQDPGWLKFLKCTFGNLLSVFWCCSGILSFILYIIDPRDPPDESSLFLGILMLLVVVGTGGFIFYFEGKSSNLMSTLGAIKPKSIIVIRNNGVKQEVDPRELVPGDIICIQMGMLIPADLRVIECSSDLQVDNSSLTGESDPQQRTWKSESDEIIPAEAKNLCFYGTFVLNGNGIACVIATGNNTFMGRTAALASYTEENVTPLMIEINNLVMKLSIFASCIGLAVFIPAMVISTELWMRNLMILISLIITNIPGGLLIVTCIQLTLTAKILYRKNVQIKQLGSVETLGSTNVICSDKTGTLTTNIMTVQHIYFNLKDRICDTINPLHALRGDFYRHESEMTPERDTSSSPRPQIDNTLRNIRRPKDEFLRLIRCGALCNNANFLEETGDMDPTANATEAAILKFSSGHIISHYKQNINEYRRLHRKLHEIPFNSKNKWQVSIHQLPISPFMNIGNVSNVVSQQSVSIGGDIDDETKDQDSGPESKRQCIIQMKGAPERILNLCDKYVVDGEIMDLDEEVREQIMNDILALGAKGERVLAFCELTLDSYHYDINIEEPEIEAKYEEVIDEACNDKDVVMIDFEGKKYKISIDLDVVNRDKDEDDKVTFESVMIQDLMKLIEQQMNDEYHVYIPMGSQRIAYGDHGSALDEQLTFKELGIKQGSLIYLLRGPYRFKGTCINDVNFPFNREQDKEGLVFIGLFAMIDPPRPGVPEAVKTCQEAGIKVIMVTGDHPVTAKAIAEKVGIINEDKSENTLIYDRNNLDKDQFKEGKFEGIVVPGWELQHVLDQEPDDPQGVADFWNSVLACDNIVFARTSPQQKLLIVSAVQERGAIVAVTGDGVNDSPALKKADIGIAMGITGTQVAKESANMILLDDNFSTIIIGIKQGRIIFDNLKKSISYSLGKCMGQVFPFVVTIAFGVPLPLTPLLLLCIDGGTDLIPAISLCMEESESDIMRRKPRNPKRDRLATMKLILNTHLVYGVFGALAGLYGYFTVLHRYGMLPAHVMNRSDYDSIFSFNGNRDDENLRDGYYFWCFKPEVTTQCFYYPNFVNQTLFNTRKAETGYYYDQNQWYGWQQNNNDYAKESKNYLVSLTSSENNLQITLNQLNGKDRNGVKCCNVGLNGSACTQPDGSLCNSDYLDWKTFYNDYWNLNDTNNNRYGVLYQFNKNVYTNSDVFKNRRCWPNDYFSLYSKYKDQPNLYCNILGHDNGKPRTYEGTPNSLFPIQTRTRTEALSRAQTALVMGIFWMQLAHLLTVRTRRSSLFEQGMLNEFMNYGLIYQIFLISFIVYIPFMNELIGSRPLRFVFWTPAMPFFIVILFLHEFRKGMIRKDENESKFITRNTYW